MWDKSEDPERQKDRKKETEWVKIKRKRVIFSLYNMFSKLWKNLKIKNKIKNSFKMKLKALW